MTMRIICPDCHGEGSLYTSRYGGNDPDVWRTGPCDRCDRTGYATVQCVYCGEADAVSTVDGECLCAKCVALI